MSGCASVARALCAAVLAPGKVARALRRAGRGALLAACRTCSHTFLADQPTADHVGPPLAGVPQQRPRVHGMNGAPQAAALQVTSARAILLAVGVLGAAILRAAPAPAAFTADLSQGQVEIKLVATPGQVRADRDLIVTFTITAPAYLKVVFPDLRDRFGGFRAAEGFSRDPVPAAGSTRWEHRWRLVPDLLRAWRLAPFAVEVIDTRMQPHQSSWFATRPVVFPAAPAPDTVSGAPEVSSRPFWIPPTPRTVLGWIGVAVLAALVVAGVVWGLTLLRRRAHERRLSPRERALNELERLLRRDLVGQRLYKDFYIELTMVVRRYIERAHAIHAPEETTEEFLAEAARHPRFTPAVLAKLRTFLESADLVKFAGRDATPAIADDAVSTARDYVETDAADSGPQTPGSGTRTPNPEP